LLFRHVLGWRAIYRVSKFAKTVPRSSLPGQPVGSSTMSLSGARVVARTFQASLDFGQLGLLDLWNGADLVNRSAGDSKFVSDERNDIVTCDGTALCLAGKSHDACVMLTVQGNEHVRLRGNVRWHRIRRVCRRSTTGEKRHRGNAGRHCASANHGDNLCCCWPRFAPNTRIKFPPMIFATSPWGIAGSDTGKLANHGSRKSRDAGC
jgi:hypothetical protein